MSDTIGNMLSDENDSNIVSLGKGAERLLDLRELSVLFDNQEIGSLGSTMSDSS
jgi:hypothetical protein